MSLKLLFCIASLFLAAVSGQKSCKALVMEGGGDLGAYEAGVLSGFIHNTQNPADFAYDVITGISIGAINGMAIAQYPPGEEVAAFDFLVNGWKTATQRNVLKNYPGGILEGLFFEPSLFNNDPEIDFLSDWITTAPNKRRITVVTTDFSTGEKVTFSEKDWAGDTEEDRQMAMSAALWSSAVPVVFKYRNYNGRTFVDGGWSGEGLDVEDAIFRCREIVDDDSEITVDVLFATNISFSDVSQNSFNSFKIMERSKAIHKFASSSRAYTTGRDGFPTVNFRYVMIASEKLPDQSIPLDFNPKNIDTMLAVGQKDAISALAEGPGVSAKRVYDWCNQYLNQTFFNTGA